MPSSITVRHPINEEVIISFDQKDHSYIDNNKQEYVSVTTLVSKAFPEFNRNEVAEKVAMKKGLDKDIVIKQWQNKSIQALRNGNRYHEYIEKYILGQKLFPPETIQQKIKFNQGKKIVDNLKQKGYKLYPEKLVFSPDFGIAGSIDLLVKVNDHYYIIIDWKNLSKNLQKISFNNKCGNIYPTKNIMDCNYYHYALQLQIYQNLLRSEKYINEDSIVEKKLIVWNGHQFITEEISTIKQSWILMLWKNKLFPKNKYY